ncbi:MAG: streptomycin 6-kinase [Litorilinea sp.]|nr:MAG: streptomycin 6-kinase [Litorilinea sp.]
MQPIPTDFARRMVELHGPRGEAWLRELPRLVDACARRWSLQVLPHFPGLSYNYVAPAVDRNGTPLVLKLGVPTAELSSEIAALRFYDGYGIARLLDADEAQGALLLERLQPGTELITLEDDEQATAIAAQVMRELWRPIPPDHPFPTVATWGAGFARLRAHFQGGTGPFPPELVARAEGIFAEFLASMAEPVLLHGDLHQYNILASTRRPWLALDPKGIVGEPAYEPGAFLRNPLPDLLTWPQPARALARRIHIFAEILELERERILGWGMAQAVLSAWWSYEDHGHGWEPAMACAELLAGLM